MENAKAARKRQDIEAQWKWRLEDIYTDDAAWEQDFTKILTYFPALTDAPGTLSGGNQAILAAIELLHSVEHRYERLYSYARMHRDEDNRNTVYQAFVDRLGTLGVQLNEASSAIKPALLRLPEQTLADCAKDPMFADYTVYIKELLRGHPHTLSAEQERILAMTGEVMDAPSTIYDMLTDADMRFPSIENAEGQMEEITHARYRNMISGKDRRVRREAFEAVMGAYGKLGNTFAATYGASVKADVFGAKVRNFGSAIQATLHPDEVPEVLYENLIRAVHDALPALHRYIGLRKDALDLDEIHLYDLYVNMVKDFDMPLQYEEAYELVLEALAPLGKAYQQKVREARQQGWIDVYESEGKTSGAYSWGVYGVHPYVLLNFEPGIDAASTVAHEIGHAMHTYYSNDAQCFAKASYTLFAAEVASTVNEILLSCHLLNKLKDPTAQAYVMGELMEGFRTTVFRQTLFAEFERKSHAMAESGEALTQEALSDEYYKINEHYYGACCVVDEGIRNEWMRIPHFYRAFYVYKYATGFSAAVAIARRILREGQSAVDDYMKFLSAGKSLPPIEALRLAGIDMATDMPIREALAWFAEIEEQFEALIGK